MEHDVIWESLLSRRVHLNIVSNIYKSAKVVINRCGNSNPIRVCRQGDQPLVLHGMEQERNKQEWLLYNLYATRTTLCFLSLQTYVQEISEENDSVWLRINLSRTLVTSTWVDSAIFIDGRIAYWCTNYADLVQRILCDIDSVAEMVRRFQCGWTHSNDFAPTPQAMNTFIRLWHLVDKLVVLVVDKNEMQSTDLRNKTLIFTNRTS